MRLLLALIVIVAAAQANAQNLPRIPAGSYFDGGGYEAQVSEGGGFAFDRLNPSARTASEILMLFSEACLRAEVGTEAARPAVNARANWGFRFLDADAGVSSHGRLDGWQADDVSVTSQPHTWPLAVCNVSAARLAKDNLTAIVADLSERLGTQPEKRFAARTASGRKIEGETVRWKVKSPSGAERRVYASSFTELNGAFALHLGLTQARLK